MQLTADVGLVYLPKNRQFRPNVSIEICSRYAGQRPGLNKRISWEIPFSLNENPVMNCFREERVCFGGRSEVVANKGLPKELFSKYACII